MHGKRRVSHHHAAQLLHNKFVVVLGDSLQRAVYKDIVLLLQKDRYLSANQLKTRGEMSFEQDRLVEGGCLKQMNNGTGYREVRQFRSDHHLVRFYFVTRIYSSYIRNVLEDFRRGLKPDVVIVNSCVWDISRYSCRWIDDYKDDLQKFFSELKEILPERTLVIWNLTMPLGERMKGGFLVPEIEHKAPLLRDDVIEANFYSGALADSYEMDVLDLHYHFRFFLQHRAHDGVHWNALAHRWITCLLLKHIAQAWGVALPLPQAAGLVEEKNTVPDNPQFDGSGKKWKRQKYCYRENRKPALPQPLFNRQYGSPRCDIVTNSVLDRSFVNYGLLGCCESPVDFGSSRPYHFDPYVEQRFHEHHSYILRHRHIRPHYRPYTRYTQRPNDRYYHHR